MNIFTCYFYKKKNIYKGIKFSVNAVLLNSINTIILDNAVNSAIPPLNTRVNISNINPLTFDFPIYSRPNLNVIPTSSI